MVDTYSVPVDEVAELTFLRLWRICAALRDRDPWTRKQTVSSMLHYSREEAGEVEAELTALLAAQSETAAVASSSSMHSRSIISSPSTTGTISSSSRTSSSGTRSDVGDTSDLEGELGDLLFDAVLMLQVAQLQHGVSPARCVASIEAKLRRRCPYIFDDFVGEVPATEEDAKLLWQQRKAEESGHDASAAGWNPALAVIGFVFASAALLVLRRKVARNIQ